MKKLFIILILFFALTGCTQNARVKTFGGTAVIELPSNQKLINVTWKNADLWILTRERTNSDTVKYNYSFIEKSHFGLLQGTYIIHEK